MKCIAMNLALILWAGVGFQTAQAQSCDRCILRVLQAEPGQTKCESSSDELVSIRDGIALLAQFLDRSALNEPDGPQLPVSYYPRHRSPQRRQDLKTPVVVLIA